MSSDDEDVENYYYFYDRNKGTTKDLQHVKQRYGHLFRMVNGDGVHPVPKGAPNPTNFPGITVDLHASEQVLSGGAIAWHGNGIGGCCCTPSPMMWLAHGSVTARKMIYLYDVRDHLEDFKAPPPDTICFNKFVANVKAGLPNGGDIRWFKTSDHVFRMEPMCIGELVPWKVWLESQPNPIELIRDALCSNRFTAAVIAREFPGLFAGEPIYGATPETTETLLGYLRACLLKTPEVAEFYPRSFVLENLTDIEELYRLPRMMYDTPQKFAEIFIDCWGETRIPCLIPWDYARDTFSEGDVRVLERQLINLRPDLLWASPLSHPHRLTPRTINRWINHAEQQAKRGNKDEHPCMTTWIPKHVFTASQFRRIILARGVIPTQKGRDKKELGYAPMDWWTPETLRKVFHLVKSFVNIPFKWVTSDMVKQWMKENNSDYMLLPKALKTAETDELAFELYPSYGCRIKITKMYVSSENKTLNMSIKLVRCAGEDGYLLLKEHLPDLMHHKDIIDALLKSHASSERIYAITDVAVHSQLDDYFVRNLFSAIPLERRTDSLSRRSSIGWWDLFTPTVQEERRIENDQYICRMRQENYGCGYDYSCGDDLYDGPTDAEIEMASERGVSLYY